MTFPVPLLLKYVGVAQGQSCLFAISADVMGEPCGCIWFMEMAPPWLYNVGNVTCIYVSEGSRILQSFVTICCFSLGHITSCIGSRLEGKPLAVELGELRHRNGETNVVRNN